MSEEQTKVQELVDRLLPDRDAEYRRTNLAEQKVAELSDMSHLRAELEQKAAEQKKEISKKEKTVASLEAKVQKLEQRLRYLERKMRGSMSEKRRLPEDPAQLKQDFEELDFEDEELEVIKEAADEIKKYREVKVKAHTKRIPVQQKLPKNLPRVEEHVYPQGYIGHEDEWVLFEETETSEHLELKPAEFFVRVTVRHKGMRMNTKEIITAPVPVEPIAKSYATASLLTDLMVSKYVDHLPFYRQIQMYKRLGVRLPISSNTQ